MTKLQEALDAACVYRERDALKAEVERLRAQLDPVLNELDVRRSVEEQIVASRLRLEAERDDLARQVRSYEKAHAKLHEYAGIKSVQYTDALAERDQARADLEDMEAQAHSLAECTRAQAQHIEAADNRIAESPCATTGTSHRKEAAGEGCVCCDVLALLAPEVTP